ncbi:DUF5344 family protein [Listeria welshimeri]|nr:hypothetical protein [Listeria monocytogenes]MBC1343624.1 DUF5344 family protein [Listeria welshimeri]EEO7554405.1 hypothetical protein [Listeria monocytogenes]EEO9090079.1 hypothetical protein [Listeria monocytogenes]MBC1693293.1 DUF5344 family protein [Listeria welshimeri]
MSGEQIFINPEGLNDEVKEFSKTSQSINEISNSKLKDIKKDLLLESVNELEDLISEFLKCIESYIKLSEKDIAEIEKLKEAWIKGDEEIAKVFNQ